MTHARRYRVRTRKERKAITAMHEAARVAHKRTPHTAHCGTKQSYPTRAEAYGARSRLAARFDAVPLDAYHCRACGAYHLGRARPPKRSDS